MAGMTGELSSSQPTPRSGCNFDYVGDVMSQCAARHLCSLCKYPANMPVLHDCAALLCFACAAKSEKCPVCYEKILGNTKPLVSKIVLVKLDAIQVRCPACRAAVMRNALDDHVWSCPTNCPKGCGAKVSPQNQDLHEKFECLNVAVACGSCHETVLRKVLNDGSHAKLDCPTNCPNGCGENLKPREMDVHLSTTCGLTVVNCSSQFCTWKGSRSSFPDHASSCILIKVSMAFDSLITENKRLHGRVNSGFMDLNRQRGTTLHKLEQIQNEQGEGFHQVRDENVNMHINLTTMGESLSQLVKSVAKIEESHTHEIAALNKEIALLHEENSKMLKFLNMVPSLSGKVSVLLNYAPFPKGIMQNVPIAMLQGWNVHYKQLYSHATKPSDIDPGQGDWILVASQEVGSELLSLCAIGNRSKVCARIRDCVAEGGSTLTAFPRCLSVCSGLTSLILNHNEMTRFPVEILDFPSLKSIDLSFNKIREIPPEINKLTALQSMFLSHNKLRSIPLNSISQIPCLSLVDVGFNFITFPSLTEDDKLLIDAVLLNVCNQHTPDLIVQGLYLGSVHATHDPEELAYLGITHVLDVGVQPLTKAPSITYLYLEVRDIPQEDIISKFPSSNEFIDSALQSGGRVLVHCAAGQSRSPSFIIAYLMQHHHMSLQQALTHTKSARLCVSPNLGFQRQLAQFSTTLHL
ncbi:dual specificity protein phosphatase [Pelomyxa schiedti]|nr:dual specificity protein phosphatase [Pelomyxa schiedti]